ncbi:MAG: CPBP family intramembrane glutamic endopeptidase [Ignavibacteriaceae bacterium]|jgi:membrane protease YdiL (CAAX protease family)
MNKQLWTYAFFAYLFTWVFIFTIYFLFKNGEINKDQLNILYTFGSLGPTLSALLTTALFYKKKGLMKLFGSLNFKKLDRKTWLIAFSPILFFLIGLLIYPLLTGHWYSFEITKEQFNLLSTASYLAWALPFIPYAIFEEIGWRGFALPHLQENYTAFKSTIVLTCIWVLWHIPMFLFRFNFSIGISIGFFFGIFVGAIILTSLVNFSRGSIIAAITFHLTNNIASAFDKDYIVAVVSTGFVFLAIFIIKQYKTENLADKERIKNYYR